MIIERNIRCLKCGSNFSISLDTDLVIKDLIILAKCPNCGSTIQINFTDFGSSSNLTDQPNPTNPLDTKNIEDTNASNAGNIDMGVSVNDLFNAPPDTPSNPPQENQTLRSPIDEVMITVEEESKNEQNYDDRNSRDADSDSSNSSDTNVGIIDIDEQFPTDAAETLNQIINDEDEDEE